MACRILVFVLTLLFSSAVTAHDFYRNKSSPTKDDNGSSRGCCNDKDCASRPVRLNEKTGEIEMNLNGIWWSAMDPRWYLGESPDGSWYGCMMPDDIMPRCSWGGLGS